MIKTMIEYLLKINNKYKKNKVNSAVIFDIEINITKLKLFLKKKSN